MGHHEGRGAVEVCRPLNSAIGTVEEFGKRAEREGLDIRYFQLQPGGFKGCYTAIGLPGFRAVREAYPKSLHIAGQTPAEIVCVILPLEIGRSLHYRGLPVTTAQCIGVAPKEPLDIVAGPGTTLVRIQISAQLHERICHAVTGRGAPCEGLGGRIWTIEPRALDRLKRSWLDVLSAAANGSGLPKDAHTLDSRARLLAKELIWAFSACTEKPQVLSAQDPSGWASYARSARSYMEANCRRPLALDELSKEAGVSRRTLQYAFRDYFGISPARYHKQLRLIGAREDLEQEDPATTSVTEIATNWGFWHFGRFSADYKGQFGELPSQTLARRRSHDSRRAGSLAIGNAAEQMPHVR